MRIFLTIYKNNWKRTAPRAASLLVFTVFTLITVLFSVYITGTQQVKAHIAFVSENVSVVSVKNSTAMDVTVLSQKPPKSTLVQQKYDAFVTVDSTGKFHIETLRNNDFKQMLLLLLENPHADVSGVSSERGVGVNIIGFMMMFLLMIAFFNLFAFADDKEQGQLRRIAAAPASFGWYLAAHVAYCLSMLLPEYVLLIVMKIWGWDIGFSLLQYAGLMGALAFLGISFALLLHTLMKKPDSATMLGNSVTVLTSILAGSFYSFSKNNAILDEIIKAIPQKQLMNFAQSLEGGNGGEHWYSMAYVILFALILFVFSTVVLRRIYVKKV